MIYIVHGENESSSRNTILNLQKKLSIENKSEVTILETTPDQLFMCANSFDFFGNPPFVVFNISRYGHMKLDPYLDKIKKIHDKSILIIYSNKALTTTNLFIKEAKNIKATVIYSQLFPSSNVFKFTDYILSGQKQKAYSELKKLTNDNDADPFQIIGAILFNIRAAAYIKFNSPSAKSIAPFVKGKAEALAGKISEKQITEIYALLYKSDKDLKTSGIDSEIILPLLIERVSGVLNVNAIV